MKFFIVLLALVAIVMTGKNVLAAGGGFSGETFLIKKCYEGGATGAGSYTDPASGAADGDIVAVPAKSVVDRVDVVVVSALVGTTEVTVGDDDDADGFAAAADVTEATPAVYNGAGAYLAAGAKKFYAATGKELKLDITGALTSGKYCVVAKGYRL